ncbi:hypothetical protein JCM8547_005166 [Rhodosporidiobolus lusitaniae]
MHCTPSTSSVVALVASAALFASSVEALPTHRSTSSIARRAHLASHHQARQVDTTLGDHSIVVDASTSSSSGNGGIKNSTINLTSISRRSSEHDSTFSSFARVIRSFFGSSSSSSSAHDLPLTVAASNPSAARRRALADKSRRSQAAMPNHVKRIPHAARAIALAGAKAPRSGLDMATRAHQHTINSKKNKKRSPRPSPAVVLEERAINYTDASAQAAAYSAAVAALGDDTPQTASAVINAAIAAPSASYGGALGNLSALANLPNALPTNTTTPSAVEEAPLPPITMTLTLVPSGINGAYVDAAGLAAAASPTASSSSSMASNPKLSSSAVLSTLILPTSAPSSAAVASGARMVKRVTKRSAASHKASRKVHVGGAVVGGSKVVWTRA